MPTRDPNDTAYSTTDRNRAGSFEARLSPDIVQQGLNTKCSVFPGALPVRATTGFRPTVREERAEQRRERVRMAAIAPAFPTTAFHKR